MITGGCGRGRRACCNMIGLNWGLQEVLQKFEQVDLTTEMSNGSLELYLVRTHTHKHPHNIEVKGGVNVFSSVCGPLWT